MVSYINHQGGTRQSGKLLLLLEQNLFRWACPWLASQKTTHLPGQQTFYSSSIKERKTLGNLGCSMTGQNKHLFIHDRSCGRLTSKRSHAIRAVPFEKCNKDEVLCSNVSPICHTSEYEYVSHTKVQSVCSERLYKSSFGVKHLVWSLLCNLKRLAYGRHLMGRETGKALYVSLSCKDKNRDTGNYLRCLVKC